MMNNNKVVDIDKLIRKFKKESADRQANRRDKEYFKKKSTIRHEKKVARKRTIEKNKKKQELRDSNYKSFKKFSIK